MIKKIKIVPLTFGEQVSNVHYAVNYDGIITFIKTPVDNQVVVGYANDEGELNDAQCQALVSFGLAACVNYRLVPGDIECEGVSWDELVRRG